MKKLLISLAAIAALATPAAADGLSFGGYGEYAIEAESIKLGVGADYVIGLTTFSADLAAIKYNGQQLDLDSLDLSVGYDLNEKANLYTTISLDSNLKYDEAVIGIALKF